LADQLKPISFGRSALADQLKPISFGRSALADQFKPIIKHRRTSGRRKDYL